MDIPQPVMPLDQTLDAQSPNVERARGGKLARALIEGSSPQLSSETHDLLRRRLRSASLLLFAGFTAFFAISLFQLNRFVSTLDWLIFVDHGLMVAITGLVGVRLCGNCGFILRHLRAFELAVFGGSTLFFLVLSYWMLIDTAAKGYILSISPIWLLLIFTYALFIPNTLRRASWVLGSMAVAPVLLMIGAFFTSPDFANLLRTNADFSNIVLEVGVLMSLAAATAIWGSHTIGNLRREVFEAKQLNQYRLTQLLGTGGMGEVYLAEHLLLKRPCAIKLIRPNKAGDARALARFEREVQATARLTHLNTIDIYDYGRANDGTFYYVMEYLSGLNLSQLVQLHGPLPAERVIHLLTQTCDALREAHGKHLVHRDIKPANIFAAHRGGVYDVAKLLDFGLAKPISNIADTSLTLEGTITGSPLYMAPEQITGDVQADARSDIYSLGLVAYYLLAGRPLFDSQHPMKVMLAHAGEEPVPPSQHVADIPEDLERVVLRCLEKNPDDRFQDAESLRQALLECRAAGGWTREMAARWWECYGCPKKRALDDAVLQRVCA